MQIVVDGLMTHYQSEGAGKTILLIHGWGDNLSTFNGLSKTLVNNYQVIRLDLPGFGDTDTPTDTYNLEKYGNFVSDFLEKLDVKNLAVVIGHSNGGAIAIKMISTSRIQPEKLVLIASSGIRSTYKGRKKLLRIVAKSAKYPTKLFPEKTQLSIKKKVYKRIGSDLFVAENMQDTFKAIISEDLLEQSKKIKTKTLLIYGSEDEATPVVYGEQFRDSIKDSNLSIVSGAGHFVHQTNSQEVEKLVLSFLEQR